MANRDSDMVGNGGAARTVRRRRSPVLLAALLVFALTAPVPGARAIGDELDPTFGLGGRVKGPAGLAAALVVQPDGGLVTGGCSVVTGNCIDFTLNRYSAAGVVDSSFGVGGTVTTNFDGDIDGIAALAVQLDGKLVAAGRANIDISNLFGTHGDFAVARYNADGSLDTTFGVGGMVTTNFVAPVPPAPRFPGDQPTSFASDDSISAVAIQPDGKIVVAGTSAVGSGADFALARYNPDGSIDTTFGVSGKMTTDFGGQASDQEGARTLVIHEGKVLAAGRGGPFVSPTLEDFALARYNPDGSLDSGFGAGGKVTTDFGGRDYAYALMVQGDKAVVAGGTFKGADAFALARYNANGTLDTTFGPGGRVTGPAGHGRAIVAQGTNLAVAGSSLGPEVPAEQANSDFVVARYSADGAPDASFGVGGAATTDFGGSRDAAFAVAVQGTGKLVAAGQTAGAGGGSFQVALARYGSGTSTQATDLGVTLTDAPDPAAVGDQVTYRATVTNIGPGGAELARLVAPVPIGARWTAASSSQGTCTRSPAEAVCELGLVVAGQSVTVGLVATATAEGTITASVVTETSSADTNPLNNTASTTTTVGPATGEWDATAPMTAGRTFHTATLLSGDRCAAAVPSVCGQVLVVGGQAADKSGLTSVELYDPASARWSSPRPMGTARFQHTATLLPDGRVLVTGGRSDAGSVGLTSAEIYDPATDQWRPLNGTGQGLRAGRFNHTATLLGDLVLVAGGDGSPPEPPCGTAGPDVRLNSAELFAPSSGISSPVGKLAHGREQHTASPLPSGAVLSVGGYKGARFNEDNPDDPCDGGGQAAPPEVFVPATGTWRATGDNAIHRWNHTATELNAGRVLIAGGTTNSNGVIPTQSAELYDPLAIDTTGLLGAWRSVRSLGTARAQHTATRLAGGQVLVTGGRDRESSGALFNTFSSAELYDPVRNRWSSAGLMTTERSDHTATLLGPERCGANCGKVLVVGGEGSSPTSRSSAELYTPAPVPAVAGLNPARGPSVGGTPVVITGSGFGRADLVRFGETEATFRVDSPNRITATSPALPGGTAVDVVVSGPGGTSSIGPANRFTYDLSPPGSVGELVARAESETVIALSFTAPGGDGPFAPAARRYRIKQSRTSTMPDAAAFAAAPLLCECEIDPPPGVGDAISLSVGDLVPGTTYHYAVQALNEAGQAGPISNTASATTLGVAPGLPPTTLPGTQPGSVTGAVAAGGYRLVAADGGVFAFGDARFLGSTGAIRLSKPVVGMASTPSGNGYRLVAADGGVFAFGDARFLGSTGAIRLNRPVVGMASTPSGNGYWLVAADGGIFAFGDARFLGSTGAIRLNRPIVGMAVTRTGNGYWLAAADGGIFAFGDARFLGSTGAIRLAKPVVGMAAAPSGNGYWLVAEDGGIFAFGDARFLGSTGAIRLNRPIVGMASTPSGGGYRLVGADGGIFAFGAAAFLGSTGGLRLNSSVVGMAGGR